MTDRDPKQASEFDDLEPLPADTELVELPVDAELAELPQEVVELEELPETVVELDELPEEVVELAELPGEAAPVVAPVPATKPAPRPVAKPAPKPAPKPVATPAPKIEPRAAGAAPEVPGQNVAPRPAPAPVASAVAQPGAPLKAGAPQKAVPAQPGAVKASTGSRRERMERDKEERKAKPKLKAWDRWAGPGEKPRREMEKAPALLRKASYGLYIGCLLPWGGVTESWHFNLVEKLLLLAGLYVWHQSHMLRDGAKVPGFIAKLGAKQFLPLFVTAGVLALLGFLPILSSGSLFVDGKVDPSAFGPFAEKGFLLLAGLSITHIYDYQHGGRFNPLFPLMFLAPGIAGVMALLKVFSKDPIGVGDMVGGLGAVLVGVAGWMSAYTMYVAMKEAKAHGDAKKAAQAEARKAAREQRSS